MIVGSDGVFDNLYLDEVTALANIALPPSTSAQRPTHSTKLTNLSKRIVEAAHQKTKPAAGGLQEAPPLAPVSLAKWIERPRFRT